MTLVKELALSHLMPSKLRNFQKNLHSDSDDVYFAGNLEGIMCAAVTGLLEEVSTIASL